MFWKVNLSDREQDMLELCHALTDFFEYAARQPGQALNEDVFRRSMPQIADWLLEQFRGMDSNKQKLQRSVEALFQLSGTRRRAVAHAVGHDMEFYQARTGVSFSFATSDLSRQERAIVHDFFLYFYDVAFGRTVGPSLNGHVCRATRGELSQDYYRLNPALNHTCPVCLHHMSNAAKETELDHYFPKSRYPVLAVHPWNLMYICKDCNKTYKKSKDPLSRGRGMLDTAFRPYRDTVREHVVLNFQWAPKIEEDRVKLSPAADCMGEKDKVDAFSALFQLEERWSADLAGLFECLRQFYMDQNLDKAALYQALERQYRKFRQLADSNFPYEFLTAEYTAWLCEEQLDAFFENLDC